MGPLSFELPKYAQIVNAIQQRISDGTYPPGSPIPSEARLVEEFGASRPVVVRALGMLQQDGWIDSEQGRGRFVRHRRGRSAGGTGVAAELLSGEDVAVVRVLDVGVIEAPNRAASALGVDPGTPVLARRRLVDSSIGPVELAVTYVPVDLAAGTELGDGQPLATGVLEHLARRKGVAWDHAAERVSARLPTAGEARLLDISRRDCVLTVLVTAYDRVGAAVLATDAVMPTVRRELEDTYPLG
jgi:GntR family transcriptional regulator